MSGETNCHRDKNLCQTLVRGLIPTEEGMPRKVGSPCWRGELDIEIVSQAGKKEGEVDG